MDKIDRQTYRELDNILWDTKAKFITPENAFALYERRWGYVNNNDLDEQEKDLIKSLTAQVGNGIFMPFNT